MGYPTQTCLGAPDVVGVLAEQLGRATAKTMLMGLEAGGIAACMSDESDAICFVNETYRSAFLTEYGGGRSDFTRAITDSIRAGRGIRLQSMALDAFEHWIRQRRRDQVGAISFTADTVDGRWWWVTDSKLPNGGLVCIAQDISSLKQEEFRLRAAHASAIEEALTDCLTGVSNRRHGMRTGEALCEDCRSTGRPLAVALIDMDHFKSINDRYGHDVGDQVLVGFASTVTARISELHRFSRIGGEEFLLVFADIGLEEATGSLQSLLTSLPPVRLRNRVPLHYSVSVGVAALASGETWQRLLQRADVALYRAKANGRSRVEQASSPW